MDSVFRTKTTETQTEEVLPEAKPLSTDLATDVEVPYLERQGTPFVAEYFGIKEPAIDGQPNPETKTQFAKRMIIENIKTMVIAGEQKKVEQDARATLNTTAPTIT